jgi:hypothetical protein
MDISVALAAGAVGAGFGFVLQRGRFCLNSAFRDVLYIKDVTILRAYLLALVVTTIGANLLEQFGVLRLDQGRQEFAWLANILGGYLFGIGMVLAGGCASGTWYRVGEGLVGSWMAALGFMIGAAGVGHGALSGAYEYLRGFVLSPGSSATINGLLGVDRWAVILPAAVLALVLSVSGRTTFNPARTEYHWRTTGVLVGLVALLGWYLSHLTTGTATGISFTRPSEGLLMSAVAGRPLEWSTALLLGVPIGSFISARNAHEFSWRAPRADVMMQQFSGGLIMGAGGMLAGGCLIGHGITGLSALSAASLLSTMFMLLGSWTMVYLLFMRSPAEK